MTYRLTYWRKRGRGEQIRLLLNLLAEDYDDIYVEQGPTFDALQAQGATTLPFGSIPLLEDGDFKLVQGPVILGYLARKHGLLPDDSRVRAHADAIALGAEDLRMDYFRLLGRSAEKQQAFLTGKFRRRWLPRLESLLILNDARCFVGNGFTHADVAVWDALDAIVTWIPGAELSAFSTLAAFYARFADEPRIATYLHSDRRIPG